MSRRLYGGRGSMARELAIMSLRDDGPQTNGELAARIRHLTDDGIWIAGYALHAHMLKLEREGRVERIQTGKGATILWNAR